MEQARSNLNVTNRRVYALLASNELWKQVGSGLQTYYYESYKMNRSPMDGLNLKRKILPKTRKQKKCSSKFLNRLFFCLDNGMHSHMLYYSNPEKKEFKVHLKNKKSPRWKKDDISLFIELDSLFNRKRSNKSYEEKCKGRFKSNMRKCNKYIREISTEKPSTELTVKKYEIMKKPQNAVISTFNEMRKSGEQSQNQDKNASTNERNFEKVENWSMKTEFEQQKNETSHFSCLSPMETKALICGNDGWMDVENRFQKNVISESVEDFLICGTYRCMMDVEENRFQKNLINEGFKDHDFDEGKQLEAQASKDCEMSTVTDEYGNSKAQIDVNECLNGDPFLSSTDQLIWDLQDGTLKEYLDQECLNSIDSNGGVLTDWQFKK